MQGSSSCMPSGNIFTSPKEHFGVLPVSGDELLLGFIFYHFLILLVDNLQAIYISMLSKSMPSISRHFAAAIAVDEYFRISC